MIVLKANNSDERLIHNHEANKNKGRKLSEVKVFKRNKIAVVCSPGKTLMDFIDSLKKRYDSGEIDVFAVKCAHILESHGILPKYSVHVETNIRELERTHVNTKIRYLISTQCAQELFDHYISNGCKVYRFHSKISSTWTPPNCVSQGSNSALQSMYVAKWLGYKELELVGFDCSWEEGKHTHIDMSRSLMTDNPHWKVKLSSGKEVMTNLVYQGAASEAVRVLQSFGSDVHVRMHGDMYAQDVATKVITGVLDFYGNPIPKLNRPETWIDPAPFSRRVF